MTFSFNIAILPKTINQLSSALNRVQESSLTAGTKALLEKLEGIKRVFA